MPRWSPTAYTPLIPFPPEQSLFLYGDSGMHLMNAVRFPERLHALFGIPDV